MKRALYTTPQDAETAFYEAFEKSDLDAMMEVWADEDEIVCVHPGGPRLTGTEQVREAWRQIFAGGQTLRFRLLRQHAINGMTLVVHTVYEQITTEAEARARQPMIATNVYMRTENGWRMVVHHASPAPATPESEGKRTPKTLH
jgi:ketosteroid isomerase-like protein